MPDRTQEEYDPSGAHAPTWAALLAHWTEFAQAAKALPVTGEGGRWKSSTAAIIGLQAVTFALADLAKLAADERRLALDRARILIHANAATIHEAWKGEHLPPGLIELINDARAALRAASEAGLEWRVAAERLITEHPAGLVESLLAAGFSGDLFVPTPGVPIFNGSPAVFARAPGGGPIEKPHAVLIREFYNDAGGPHSLGKPTLVPEFRQVYRQIDFATGRAVRDLIVPSHDDLPGGQPLLVAAIEAGVSQSVTLPPRKGTSWDADMEAVRVEDARGTSDHAEE